MTTVAATGQEKYQKPYAPLTPGFKHVTINDIESLTSAITDNTCAIMLEPIQGESGVHPISKEYITKVKEICEENNLLLIYDEVQTGMGRTGKLFGYEHLGVEPDIFTLAKALGGGIPIGAVCAKDSVAKAFEPGDHGSTFGGNPFSCTAGLTVFNVLLEDGILENGSKMGAMLKNELLNLQKKYKVIKEVRGEGLMLGIEFEDELAKSVHTKLFENGILTGCIAGKILRILPPLVISEEEVIYFINTLQTVLKGMIN